MDSKVTDKQLINLILARDEHAFLELYRRHELYVRSLVRRHFADPVIVDDVTQEVFVALIDALRSWREQARFTTFLYTIVQRKCIDKIRRLRARRLFEQAISPTLLQTLHVVVDGEIEQHELQLRIEQVMSALPHDYVVVLRLKYEMDKSVKDIARELHVTVKSAESMLYRARRAFITHYGRTLG